MLREGGYGGDTSNAAYFDSSFPRRALWWRGCAGDEVLRLNIREKSIRLGQFPHFDGFLRISFQGSDFGIVAGLNRCRFLKGFEALGNFDKLGRQPLRGNIVSPRIPSAARTCRSLRSNFSLSRTMFSRCWVVSSSSGRFASRTSSSTFSWGIPILIVELLTLPPIAIPLVSALTCWASAVVCDAKKHMPNAAMRAYVRL
jgi:hypothetical protein